MFDVIGLAGPLMYWEQILFLWLSVCVCAETNKMVSYRTKSKQRYHMSDYKSKWSTKSYMCTYLRSSHIYRTMNYTSLIVFAMCALMHSLKLEQFVHIQSMYPSVKSSPTKTYYTQISYICLWCVCVCVCACVHVYIGMCIRMCVYICVCMRLFDLRTYVLVCTCMSVCVCVCMCVC